MAVNRDLKIRIIEATRKGQLIPSLEGGLKLVANAEVLPLLSEASIGYIPFRDKYVVSINDFGAAIGDLKAMGSLSVVRSWAEGHDIAKVIASTISR
jgi:hypothetical protein